MMKTIVIGDVHGCYDELVEMVRKLRESGKYNPATDTVVFLGDYIDRGNNPRMVINYVRELQAENPKVIALCGNHEDMMLRHIADGNKDWLYNGYQTTIKSYDGHDEEFIAHVDWMNDLPLYYEDDNGIYVHAGIDPTKSLDKQNPWKLLWTREEFIYDTRPFPKRVVFGHTPFFNGPIWTMADNIGIDTGCVFGKRLTAAILDGDNPVEFVTVESRKRRNYYYDYDYDYENEEGVM